MERGIKSHSVGESRVAGESVPDHHQAAGGAAELEVVGSVAVACDGVADDVEGRLKHRRCHVKAESEVMFKSAQHTSGIG